MKRGRRLLAGALGLVFLMSAPHAGRAGPEVPLPERKPVWGAPGAIPLPEHKPDVPETADAGNTAIPLPESRPRAGYKGPLSRRDAGIYRRVFALQARGAMEEADREIGKLRDHRLFGHVLYQRYMHPTAYTSSFAELAEWLRRYGDYPGAEKIHDLAARKAGKDERKILADLGEPETRRALIRVRKQSVYGGAHYRSAKTRNPDEKKAVRALNKQVRALARKNRPDEALTFLETSADAGLLDTVELDLLRADIAAAYMYANRLGAAYKMATQATRRSGLHVPAAGWVAGLIAWRHREYSRAAGYFEITGRSPYASGWTAAAGSYWAARSHMRAGNIKAVSAWLERAKEHPRSFYGLIATRALGQDFAFNWDIPTFTRDYYDILLKTRAGMRAMALVAAGQNHLAEEELECLDPDLQPGLHEAMLAYAGYAGLPGLALRLASAMTDEEGTLYDAALYPAGPWKPKDGYKVDPALIYAIMRQESRFDPNAQSHSGARGLMQLMPATASHVSGRKDFKSRTGKHTLSDPQTNLELGQRYLEELLIQNHVDGELVSLLVAYNAGPGNLQKWKRAMPEVQDPLLFIESLPFGETRTYVERVLANYWMYRLREGLPTPSLDSIASGKWARYAHMDAGETFRLADSR